MKTRNKIPNLNQNTDDFSDDMSEDFIARMDILDTVETIDDTEIQQHGKLSHKEVEAMLPDYLFNRLTEQEKSDFEVAILHYPDIEKELEEGKELFARIEQIDYKQVLNDKTQYLPDRVVARLQAHNALYTPSKFNIRRLIFLGVAAASIMIYMYMNPIKDNKHEIKQHSEQAYIQQDTVKLFSNLEKEFINEHLNQTEFLDDGVYAYNNLNEYDAIMLVNDSEKTKNQLNTYFYSAVNKLYNIVLDDGDLYLSPDSHYMMLMDNLDDIDEADFQNLINSINSNF